MDQRQARARQIQSRIGEVLLRHWDPLGIADDPDVPHDEYDGYVGGVYRLLISGASLREIAEYLGNLETQWLGFTDTNPRTLIPLAKELRRLNVRLNVDDRAI